MAKNTLISNLNELRYTVEIRKGLGLIINKYYSENEKNDTVIERWHALLSSGKCNLESKDDEGLLMEDFILGKSDPVSSWLRGNKSSVTEEWASCAYCGAQLAVEQDDFEEDPYGYDKEGHEVLKNRSSKGVLCFGCGIRAHHLVVFPDGELRLTTLQKHEFMNGRGFLQN